MIWSFSGLHVLLYYNQLYRVADFVKEINKENHAIKKLVGTGRLRIVYSTSSIISIVRAVHMDAKPHKNAADIPNSKILEKSRPTLGE